MPSCVRCGWVVNSPVMGLRLGELLGTVKQWLNRRGVKGLSSLERKIKQLIKNYGLIRDGGFCRHCLMDSVSLLIPELWREDFTRDFTSVYEFDSIIY